MSIRRINSTGRKRIAREDARILVHPDPDGVLAFDARLDLSDYALPGDADVFVEAYRQTTFMRFPHGTVAAPHPTGETSCRLTDFTSGDGLLFRVKVTSTDERSGILLAEGDRIPVSDDEEQPDNRIALLPPAPGELGQETWRVDFAGANGPLLLVNSRVGDWKALAASPLFRSLVYAAAMRQILWHIYKVEQIRDLDDAQDWRCRWLSFAAALPGGGDPPLASGDDDEWDEWITSAVESFTRQHQMLDHLKPELERIRGESG
ncbi:MAG TPA: hypothetical protein PKK06_17675 [Phycisphaerae bacterium]|nr:hypothetical protein [Phycisphaerae bacterium]